MNNTQEIQEWEFRECDTCSAKLGSPILCSGCLHNRLIISKISQKLAEQEERHKREIEDLKKETHTDHITYKGFTTFL